MSLFLKVSDDCNEISWDPVILLLVLLLINVDYLMACVGIASHGLCQNCISWYMSKLHLMVYVRIASHGLCQNCMTSQHLMASIPIDRGIKSKNPFPLANHIIPISAGLWAPGSMEPGFCGPTVALLVLCYLSTGLGSCYSTPTTAGTSVSHWIMTISHIAG